MNLTIEECMKLNYVKLVVPDETTDGSVCYLASHPELPGCMAHGETPEEALSNLEEARRLTMETLLENGQQIPIPNSNIYSSMTYDSIIVKVINFGSESKLDIPEELEMGYISV